MTLQTIVYPVSFLQMARYTTPMYRAPEMVDTWSNHAITTASDIWALGCIMYTLCYMKHPFEDSAKLRILNGNYTIPPGDLKYSCYHDIIRKCISKDFIHDLIRKCMLNVIQEK
jgi:cyclin G-associated kinase